MRYYGLDLRVEFREESARRLLTLIRGLPLESATWAEDAWTRQDELLASTLEITDGWSRLIFMALGGKAEKIQDARKFGVGIKRPKVIQQEAEQAAHDARPDLTTDRKAIKRWFAAHS